MCFQTPKISSIPLLFFHLRLAPSPSHLPTPSRLPHQSHDHWPPIHHLPPPHHSVSVSETLVFCSNPDLVSPTPTPPCLVFTRTVARVIKNLGEEGRVKEALGLFRQMRKVGAI
ncbi:hypothetical protein QJS10_CPB22g01192 [Acorus calamus]|uniref:Pentatricopeptide repeat-containing protein n=1 Tax=Acorus calamus TaxID=4465 RepID=A0AAV9BXH5_ACOCL|nr:hypothetical protein QJS10_CPB22g01192 [Acorus calamus]